MSKPELHLIEGGIDGVMTLKVTGADIRKAARPIILNTADQALDAILEALHLDDKDRAYEIIDALEMMIEFTWGPRKTTVVPVFKIPIVDDPT